jgi:hypothetical protein
LTSVPSRRAVIHLIAVAVALIAFGFRLIDVRDLSNDHYMHLAWAQQVLFGEVPGRDFVDPGLPLMYALSALVQWISPGPFSEAVLSCVLLAGAAGATFLAASDLTTSIVAGLAAAAFEIALYPRLYSYPKILVPAVALVLIQQYIRRPGRRPLVWLAIWTGVSVLLRHDLGVYTAAGIGTALLWTHWGSWTHAAHAVGEYAGAVVATMIPYVLFVQWGEGLPEHFHEALEFAKGEAHQRFLAPPTFEFFGNARGLAAWSKVDSAVLLFYVAHALALAALILLVTRRRWQPANPELRIQDPEPVLAAALAMLVLYLVVVLRHPIDSRIQDVAALLSIVGIWALAETGRRAVIAMRRGPFRAQVLTASAFAIALAVAAASAASLWDLGNITLRLKETRVADGFDVMARTVQGIKETGTRWPWERFWPAGELPEAVRYVNACTTPDDAVLLTWAAPEYYYFARRRFAAGHALFLPPDAFTTDHDQTVMLARIRKQRIPIVLINETRRMEFATAYGRVDAYLKQEYLPVGHFQIRDGSDVTIAIRRGVTAHGTYRSTGWPCVVESRAASTTASIMLDGSATPFPAISNAVP